MLNEGSLVSGEVASPRRNLLKLMIELARDSHPQVGKVAADCLERVRSGKLLLEPATEGMQGPVHVVLQLSPDLTAGRALVTPVVEFDQHMSAPTIADRDFRTRFVAELVVAAQAPDRGYQRGLRDVYTGAYKTAFKWSNKGLKLLLRRSEIPKLVRQTIDEPHFVTNVGFLHWQITIAQHLKSHGLDSQSRSLLTEAANDPLYFLNVRTRFIKEAYRIFIEENARRIGQMNDVEVGIRTADILVGLARESDYSRLPALPSRE